MSHSYQSIINYLFKKLPIYQRTGEAAYKKDIGNITQATKILGYPHLDFPSIHIAGTNGKGSTAHIISSILQEAGYKVGLYTSPHIKDFRERIKINGKMIPKKEVIDFIKKYKNEFEKINMSFFEMTVALSFYHFSKKNIDIGIIECGLGGRLDSTNIINPLISVITNISLDHTKLLGNTIEEIAAEKAGIIKKNTPVVIGEKQKICENIFKKKSQEMQSKIIFADGKISRHKTDLKGLYQQKNINTAIAVINLINHERFNVSRDDILIGITQVMKNTNLVGRWQIIDNKPTIICDSAHNQEGIKTAISELKDMEFITLHIIFGCVNDKKVKDILPLLPKNALYYFCEPNIPRALNKKKLKNIALHYGIKGNYYESAKHALIKAKNNANKKDCILVTGSTFIISDIV